MFPFKIAIKLPVYFYGRVRFSALKGSVQIIAPIKRSMIGFGQAYEMNKKSKGVLEINIQGTLVFKGYCQFGKDCFICIHENAYTEFGNMSSLGGSGKLICVNKVILNDYARIGSESQIIDTTFHQMIDTKTGYKYPNSNPIIIGAYNYISNRVSIMSKTKTPNFCTVASNSLCNKDYTNLGENILIGGVPSKLIRENLSRDWDGEKVSLENFLIRKK